MRKILKEILKISAIFLFLTMATINTTNAQEHQKEDKVYVEIEIKGMACAYCAFGMEKELKKVAGVNNVGIVLEDGKAFISTPKSQEPSRDVLSLIITNAGFTPGLITFSDQPFKNKEVDNIKQENKK